MTIVVTGALGKIGARAVESLKAAGHRVRGFDIRTGPHRGACSARGLHRLGAAC
jgi:nucleoside-diphosphate-sugar epimerase